MNKYISLTLAVLIIISITTIIYLKVKNVNKEEGISTMLITNGMGLILSSFPSFFDKLLDSVQKLTNNGSGSSDTNIISLVTGFTLIATGFFYNKSMKDRFYVLNLLSKDKRLINESRNIKDLKISDFKLRECYIDIVRMFNDANNITEESNKYIVDEIEEKTKIFINQSNDFKKAFTGMVSIPYTILSGTYLSATEIDYYYEYNRSKRRYYKLKKKNINFDRLDISNPNPNMESVEVVVSISVTKNILDEDLSQFNNLDKIRIFLTETKDNVIEYRNQLDNYAKTILDTLENLKEQYPSLSSIHLVASIPSCLSIELGRMISLNKNRLPNIISYHYKCNNNPKYSFGIIITETNKGNLLIC